MDFYNKKGKNLGTTYVKDVVHGNLIRYNDDAIKNRGKFC